MIVDSDTGAVTWTPRTDQVGRVVATWTATDADGGVAVESVEIDVLGVNSCL